MGSRSPPLSVQEDELIAVKQLDSCHRARSESRFPFCTAQRGGCSLLCQDGCRWSLAFLSLLPLGVKLLSIENFIENLTRSALITPCVRAAFPEQPPWRNTSQAQMAEGGLVAAGWVRGTGPQGRASPTVRFWGKCAYRRQDLPAITLVKRCKQKVAWTRPSLLLCQNTVRACHC